MIKEKEDVVFFQNFVPIKLSFSDNILNYRPKITDPIQNKETANTFCFFSSHDMSKMMMTSSLSNDDENIKVLAILQYFHP